MWFDVQALPRTVWELARRQHGIAAYWQLVALGFSRRAIEHRIEAGRRHPIHRGVYAVGRPEITREGEWMAAALACGAGSALSDGSAGAAMQIVHDGPGPTVITVPASRRPRVSGVRIRRRELPPGDLGTFNGIPVTSPIRTLLDLAAHLSPNELEAAVNGADKHDLIRADALRTELDRRPGQRGVAPLRALLDRHTFRLTDSELERRFLAIVKDAGLPLPETQVKLNGHRADFYWPDLGLVVETDGLRYHRTAAQQAKDRRRDQDHTAAGLIALRFSHADVRYEPQRVTDVLAAIGR